MGGLGEADEHRKQPLILPAVALGCLLVVVVTAVGASVAIVVDGERRERVDRIARSSIPRHHLSPIRVVLQSRDNGTFIKLFGVDVPTFRLLASNFRRRFYHMTMDSGVFKLRRKCMVGKRRTLDADACLSLVLSYMRSKGEAEKLSTLFGVLPPQVSVPSQDSLPKILCSSSSNKSSS